MTAERWERLARRVVLGTAAATAVLLVLAMALSYTGLRFFYLGAGLPTLAASLFPFPIDLLFPIGFVALLVLPRGRKWYAGLVVAFSGVVSAAAQGYHQSHGGVSARITDGWVLFAAGASAMVCALIAGHLLWLILERALPVGFITAMRADAPVYDAQPELARQSHVPTEPATDLAQALAEQTAERVLADLSRPLPPVPPPVREHQWSVGLHDKTRPDQWTSSLHPDEPSGLGPTGAVAAVLANAAGTTPPARLHSVASSQSRANSQEPKPCWCTGTDTRPACNGKVQTKSTWYRHNPTKGQASG